MRIAISVESTNDLTNELLEKYDIKVIPYEVTLGTECYKDGDISIQQIFDFVDKNKILPKTNAINEFQYTEYFEKLKNDYDGIVHVSLSSGLTSSCGNAKLAAKNFKDVYVVDSLSLSTGIGLLAIYARELADNGEDAKTIFEKTQERTSAIQASFIIERLDYLYKGGRCSSLALLGANLLHIRPRIVLKDGKMSADKKYRGNMGSVVDKYSNDVFNEFNTPDLERVFITYTTATPEMLSVARNACERAGFKNIYETHTGCTVASHCGANTLGILYFNDGKQV